MSARGDNRLSLPFLKELLWLKGVEMQLFSRSHGFGLGRNVVRG